MKSGAALAALCALLFSLLGVSEAAPVKLAPPEAASRIESGATVVDVRDMESYGEAHIPCALLIPGTMLEKGAQLRLPDKNAELLVCGGGAAESAEAAARLAAMGYARVFDIGGMDEWPYATEGGPEL